MREGLESTSAPAVLQRKIAQTRRGFASHRRECKAVVHCACHTHSPGCYVCVTTFIPVTWGEGETSGLGGERGNALQEEVNAYLLPNVLSPWNLYVMASHQLDTGTKMLNREGRLGGSVSHLPWLRS